MDMMHPEAAYEVEARTLAGVATLDDQTRAAMASLPPLISADSHVMEPDAVWETLPPEQLKTVRAILDKAGFEAKLKGASDPRARLVDQAQDGVEAEIIFPNSAMALFALNEIATQQNAFRVYNDWIADFCRLAPDRLHGVPCISVYDIEVAIAEMHRALDLGLTGIMVWQVPHPELSFMSAHYDRLWAAAAEAKAPVHLHILTGHTDYRSAGPRVGAEKIRGSVNHKLSGTMNSLFDLLFSGAFDRYPQLRVVIAESECGWLPFLLQQWDYYFERFRKREPLAIDRKPSEIFNEHVFCTWLEDYSGTRQFTWWGQDNLMWSNDYPHFNMTFPHSRENIIHHIGNLPRDLQVKLVRGNALRCYGFHG